MNDGPQPDVDPEAVRVAVAVLSHALGLATFVGVQLVAGEGPVADRAAGVAAAAEALSAGGHELATPLGHADDGRPLWPDGFTGSISHGGGVAVAVMAMLSGGRFVGVDVEAAGALSADDAVSVLSADEMVAVGESAPLATRMWCAKEAAFKAWSHAYLVAGVAIDPADVQVAATDDEFVVTGCGSLAMLHLRAVGRWADVGSLVITLAVV